MPLPLPMELHYTLRPDAVHSPSLVPNCFLDTAGPLAYLNLMGLLCRSAVKLVERFVRNVLAAKAKYSVRESTAQPLGIPSRPNRPHGIMQS
jgi:hypothetical protein